MAARLPFFGQTIIPVVSLSQTRPPPAPVVDVPEAVSLRWGDRADFSYILDEGRKGRDGAGVELQDAKGGTYARILRAGVTVTSRVVKIDGETPDSWAKVRRFERMQWEYEERINKQRVDERQRVRRVKVDLRFDLHPPPAEEADTGEGSDGE